MLSKKMTFSLMSLITIFALAFVAPSAMAVDFKVTITGQTVATYAATAVTDPIIFKLLVTSEEALFEPLTIGIDGGTTPDGVLDGEDEEDTLANITGEVRDNRGFTTTLWGDSRVTITDDQTGFDDRTVKRRRLSVSITPQTSGTDPIIDLVTITIPVFETPDTRVGDEHDESIAVTHTILVREEDDVNYDADDAKVVSIQRLRPGSQAAVATFQDEEISPDPFNVRVVLTEMRFDRIALDGKTPDELAKELVAVGGGEASNLVVGTLFRREGNANANTTIRPHPREGRYTHSGVETDGLAGEPIGLPPTAFVPMPTGLDNLYHEYRVTITPQRRRGPYTLTVGVKGFSDYSPTLIDRRPNGREQLRIPVARDLRDLDAGYRVYIGADVVIPAGGYLIVTESTLSSEIVVPPGDRDKSPKAYERRPPQMLYNIYQHDGLPNLADDFRSGVVIDVEYGTNLVISEVMWGTDNSLNRATDSQWIELYNPGSEHKTVGDDASTYDIDERLTLVFYGANEFDAIQAKTDVAATATTPATMALPARVTDRIGTLDATGAYWSPNVKGQSGASGTLHISVGTEDGDIDVERTLAPSAVVIPIVSMYRVMEVDGTIDPLKGQMTSSWMQSAGPKSANFNPGALGIRQGTPGAATGVTDTPADAVAEAKAEADAAKAKADAAAAAATKVASTGTMPEKGEIYISEIMVAGGGILPQWIEIANGSDSETVNLSSWTLTVDNAAADADVSIGASAKFTIPDGTMIRYEGSAEDPVNDTRCHRSRS